MFATLDLNTIWFVLIGVLLAGYAVLDGFDLGVGALHLFAKTDGDRRLFLNSIGPVWDGNEVWLVAGGGALFAAFPMVYATVFSGFYLAFILLLFALIFRAVAIEFRSRQPQRWWRQTWDVAFSLSSILIAFLIGVAIGNIARGIPLDADHEFAGTFLGLLHPYAILSGLATVALFAIHGAIYLAIKLPAGDLHDRVSRWLKPATAAFALLYILLTLATLLGIPHIAEAAKNNLWLPAVLVLGTLALANVPRCAARRQAAAAFASSSLVIICLMALFAGGMYPDIVPSIPDPANSLNIHNAASSRYGLSVMFTIALIGLPLVITYSIVIHWVFRGKTRLAKDSY